MQYTFKSSINCGACVAKVTGALNDMLGENAWKVDTSVKEKTLTIESDALDLEKLETVLSGLGYRIQPLAPLA